MFLCCLCHHHLTHWGLVKHVSVSRLLSTWVNTMRPKHKGPLTDDIFKWIFMNDHVWIPIKFFSSGVNEGAINNILVLVQIRAWRRPGDKPLSQPMMVNLPAHIYVTRPQSVNRVQHFVTEHGPSHCLIPIIDQMDPTEQSIVILLNDCTSSVSKLYSQLGVFKTLQTLLHPVVPHGIW